MKSFWKDGLSINETKLSLTALLLIVSFVYILVAHFRYGEISFELVDIFKGLLLAFVGVNAVDRVSQAIEGHKQNEEQY